MADPNTPIPSYPIVEPTSALTFSDLILEVAYKIGVAYYGADGTGAAAIPVDAHDLALCKRIVNKAVRKFINDAPPPSGWRWTNVIGQVDLWPLIAYDFQVVPTTYVTRVYDTPSNTTTLTLTTPGLPAPGLPVTGTPAFYQSMELRQIFLNGNPPAGTPGFNIPSGTVSGTNIGTSFTVLKYLSPTVIVVDGNATGAVGTPSSNPAHCPFSFAQQGDYTMPANFSGQFTGDITYIANTNRGMILRWVNEASIRSRRQNYNIESGTPYEAAVRLIPTPSYAILTNASGLMTARRRWELMTWRISSEFLSVIFPYILGYNDMVNLTDVPPAPFAHDEAIKAACLAVAEKEVEDAFGPDWQYYHSQALPNSYRVDAMSAPKTLGYFGNPNASLSVTPPIKSFRDNWYQRPTVPVFGRS